MALALLGSVIGIHLLNRAEREATPAAASPAPTWSSFESPFPTGPRHEVARSTVPPVSALFETDTSIQNDAESNDTTSPPALKVETIGDRMVLFLEEIRGQRVGGGECAHLAAEALRIAGGEFVSRHLGEETPEPGDYVWGTLVKIVDYADETWSDSNPVAMLCPGDVLQFHAATLVSDGTVAHYAQHTSVVAAVNRGAATEVYHQNLWPSNDPRDAKRYVIREKIDLTRLRRGWIRIYRPKPRIDDSNGHTFAIVNNFTSDCKVFIKLGDTRIGQILLTAANTPASYSTQYLVSSPDTPPSLCLGDEVEVKVENGAGYEIHSSPDGAIGLRKLDR